MNAEALDRVPAVPRSLADRLLRVVPLVSLFFWLCVLYAWECSQHKTPWLFSDELEFTQLSRAIAETGHAARRGEPHSFNSLYTYLTAPAWLSSHTATGYAAAKYIGVLTMSSVVFPTYALARLVASRPAALFAAAGAGAAPALAYSSLLISEPLAYPYAALAFFVIAKALVVRRRRWIAAAVAVSVVAPLVRGQLALVPAILVLAALSMAWGSERARAVRARWRAWDWIGFGVLLVGLAIVLSAVISSHSYSWLVTTRYYKGRMLEYGLWSFGALAIGLGILPFLAGAAALFLPRAERTPAYRAFAVVLWTSLLAFGLYTAVKAAYLSTVFATRVEERNVIYLAPLLFVGTALWLDRRRVNLPALACLAGLTLYLILDTPYQLQFHLYSDALGLAILEMLNRNVALDDGGAQWLLLGLLALAVLLLLAPRLALRRRLPRGAVTGLVAATAVCVLGWSLAGEISAASASNSFSRDFVDNLPPRLDWVDAQTGGQPALYLGQKVLDPNGVWQLEFWNRSVKRVWSLDGSAPGPGPILTPDLAKPNGTLFPQPGYRYIVADNGVDPVGRLVEQQGSLRLFRIAQPLRIRSSVTGIDRDGWAGARSAYSLYTSASGRAGWVSVELRRRGAWCGADVPGLATVRLGPLVVGRDHQPALGRVTAVRRLVVHGGEACSDDTLVLRTPPPPFRVEVTIHPTFSPHDLDPAGQSDARQLGAVTSYSFSETRPKP